MIKINGVSESSWNKAKEMLNSEGAMIRNCLYCGRVIKEDNVNAPFCNKEHEKSMRTVWDDRKAKGLCANCGDELPEKRFHISSCDVCIAKINLLMGRAKRFGEQVKKEMDETRNP
ncbi:unnamed protein product [marine sediment metagenome]|uniref:Uncharacterized protein n=1 Tax=marine sediment metagenome TaxID=412755 RepID=X1CA91_9ZZZZ